MSASPIRHRARARLRGQDGRVRVVERIGKTRRAAVESLTEALEELARSAGDGGLTRQDTFDAAARDWLGEIARLVESGQRSAGTLETYMRALDGHVLPALGGLRLGQVTTPAVNRVIVDLHTSVGAATARTCRSIVSGVMGRAVRHGAVPVNPARDVERLRSRPKRQPRALTVAERTQWFVGVAADRKAMERDILDLSAFLLATGLRIGEALAVIWSEIDFDTSTVTVSSTLIRVTGRGLIRKGTKSDAGQRSLLLPGWCIAMLRRRAQTLYDPSRPVFGTIDGEFRDPRNVSRFLKEAREAVGLEWVTAHAWRKTTATVLDEMGATGRMIADQLGHTRVSMAQDVYLGRGLVDPRVLAALEAVDPLRGLATAEKGGQSGG
ncbi:tyrosine-type recombinase/integrase [Terrabacter terrigena]|uniref:Tyrosine-type recombinase/integrase n=1 Tax=Terrabacter terrigena TaxID=574718 RepID=A0ABW3MUT5_9MICO